MSLLLDALKRAEQEKLARQGQDTPHEEAAAAAESAAARGRKLELEHVESTVPASAAAASASASNREAAKAVFAAKQPDNPDDGTGKNKAVIAIGIVALLVLAAGGAYVWYEINRTPSPVARASAPVSALKPVTPAPPGAPVAGGTPEAAKAKAPDEPAPAEASRPETVAAAPAKPATPPAVAEKLGTRVLRESAQAKPAPPVKLSRTIEAPRVAPDVSKGYEALKRGDAAAARTHYQAAVTADSTNLDAHLGLATAAARTGDRATATRHYRRALELDPKNPAAVAGLASLADFTRPDALEAQLRADITQYPQSAALHYTLGNLYAAQSRWNEAQAAYFESYRLDPENADLAYNLAVSLDNLGQAKLAADFYRRALAAARQQDAQFDKGQVSRRIAELKP